RRVHVRHQRTDRGPARAGPKLPQMKASPPGTPLDGSGQSTELGQSSPSAAGPANHVSLEGMHGTVAVPEPQAGFWQNWPAFVGAAILVSGGYIDPGNWRPGLPAC